MTTMNVKDAANQTVAIEKPLAPARAAAAASRPVVLSNEDLAVLQALAAGIGAPADAAETDPGENASLKALSAGVLTVLKQIFDQDEAAYQSTESLPVSTRAFAVDAANAAAAGTRPANTTPYGPNDAVSNSATAGSVVAFYFVASEAVDLPISLEALLIRTADTGPGTASAIFRAWFYQTDPAASSGIVGGDNAAFSTKRGTFLGVMEGTFRAFSDGSAARLSPVFVPSVATIPNQTRMITKPGSGASTVFCLLQTLTTFMPSANSTVFTPTLEGFQFRA